MAVDLAYDFKKRDLIRAPNKDFDVVTAQATIDQRIRVRLTIQRGTWDIDPSGGVLGSYLLDVTRLPLWRALQEAPMLVREALEPMTDIRLQEVLAEQDPVSSSSIRVTIIYVILDDEGEDASEALATDLTIAGVNI